MISRIYILIFLIFSGITVIAQQLGVKSFDVLPNDLDARVHYPREDKNGEKAALIKVVTTETGFEFEAGSIGIVATVPKTGEIWVYVPRGSKTLTIKHAQLGILRNYLYPVPIGEGEVYEMVLVSGKVVTTVEPPVEETRWLVISSEPAGADLYINDQQVGKCPYYAELPLGKYSWRMDMDLYQPEAGMVELVAGNDRKELKIRLKPDFGTLMITSSPEDQAGVTLDDVSTGKKTPCTIDRVKTGLHEVTIRKDLFETVSRQVNVTAGDTAELSISMNPTFAGVQVTSDPPADLYINGEYKSKEHWSGRLTPGIYTFEARLDHYKTDIQKYTVIVGQPLTVNLHPEAKTGTVRVITNPYDARIELDGTSQGTTPATIRNLLIGKHTLNLSRPGYLPVEQTIEIEEDKTTEVHQDLQSSTSIRISSAPSSASLSVDGKYQGITPQKLEINTGEHEAVLSKEGYQTLHQPFTVDGLRNDFEFYLEKKHEPEPEKTEIVSVLPRSNWGIGLQYYVPMMKAAYDDTTKVKYSNSIGVMFWLRFLSQNHRFGTELSASLTAFDNTSPDKLNFTEDLSAVMMPLQINEDWYIIPRTNHFFMFVGFGLDYIYWKQYSYLLYDQKETYYFGVSLRGGLGIRFSDKAGMELSYSRSAGISGDDASLYYDTFTVGFPIGW